MPNLRIQQIDHDLIAYIKLLEQVIPYLSFIPITEFTLDEKTDFNCGIEYNVNGIYLFEIKNGDLKLVSDWAATFKNLWRPEDKSQPEHSFWSPGMKKKRIAFHTDSKEWIPFYMGKCRSVGHRINEHIDQPSDRKTFSMKLRARKNIYGSVFKVSWLPLNVANYDIIAPYIEGALRNVYHPILGRQ